MQHGTFSAALRRISTMAIIVLLAFSPVSEGALIDNGIYTADTATGLDWLDLNVTLGMSYTGVLAPGGIAESGGWRHATPSEYVAFISGQTTVPFDTVVQANVVPPPDQFVRFVDLQLLLGGGVATNFGASGVNRVLRGFLASPDGAQGVVWLGLLQSHIATVAGDLPSDVLWWSQSTTGLQIGTGYADIGHWLVRDSAARPVEVQDLTLSSGLVAGCKSLTGKVTLSAPAPAGGLIVTISETLTSASAPATLKVRKGAASGSFTITTTPVSTNEDGTVSATLGGRTLSQGLTVRPIGVGSVSLKPSKVIGGKLVAGTASLECRASPGPIVVELSSSNPGVASPNLSSLVIPVSVQDVSFQVTTNPVAERTPVSIGGTANGVSAFKVLTVSP